MKFAIRGRLLALFLFGGGLVHAAAGQSTIAIQTDKPGPRVSPNMYGIFFEEISRAGDGGLYAEMLLNRSFEDFNQPVGWRLLPGAAKAAMALDRSDALNAHNPTSLKLTVDSLAPGASVGIANLGFAGALVPEAHDPEFSLDRAEQDKAVPVYADWLKRQEAAQNKPGAGLAVEAAKLYRFSVALRSATTSYGPVRVALQTAAGTVLAEQPIHGIGVDWKTFAVDLKPTQTATDARLVLSFGGRGTVWIDMASLFPDDTFLHRRNGLRADLMQMLLALHPAFMRFPGGSYGEGYTLKGAYRWKETVGDLAQRPGHWNIWGYRSTDGLGFGELLQMSEDLHAEPLYVPNCGIAEKEMVAVGDEGPWIQDALDSIAYANAPATNPWGALRVKAGHATPFHLRLMEIGNENGMSYSWGGGTAHEYAERYVPFYNAVKAAYPEMLTMATAPIQNAPERAPVEIVDEHYYPTAAWFEEHSNLYDGYDRKGPKIYVGEYATKSGAGNGNLRAALGEAAFMTGMERNADVVVMSSYAPLLVHADWVSWQPNAIVFDRSRVYGTPSYYNQLLFANNRPDVELPVRLDTPTIAQPSIEGKPQPALRTLYVTAGKKDATGEILLKLVNIDGKPQSSRIQLTGSAAARWQVTGSVLTSGDPADENSFAEPQRVAPKSIAPGVKTGDWSYEVPAYSVTVLRLMPVRQR